MLKGITVTLYQKTQTSTDPFGSPVYTESAVGVDKVLVAPASSEDIVNERNLTGKHIVYTIGIPKGDTHNWENTRVEFFGESFRTVGFVQKGIESMVPTAWHGKISCERWNDGE